MKKISILLSLLLLVSCGELNKPDVVYVVNTKNIEGKEIQIVINRLGDCLPSFLSKMDYENSSKEINFEGGSPSDEIVKYMSHNLGVFVIYLEGESNIWIQSEDIVSTSATIKTDKAYVDIMLTDSATRVLSEKTRENFGKRMVAELDGKIIVRANINAELGKYFRFTANSPEDAQRKSILLNMVF